MTALPPLTRLLGDLVAAPSVSSEHPAHDMGNLPVVHLLAEWLGGLGFTVEILPLPGRTDKANLIATLGRGPGGLVLAGHTDTVPFDAQGWDSEPFALTERDGAYYGLGICDMKGFLGLAVEAAAGFTDRRLAQPLILLATADEESGMDGARALAAAGRPKARHAVIGEPTGLRPVRLHKGILMDSLHVHGHAGHSSRPDLGANAIRGMHQVLGAVMAHGDALARDTCGRGFAIDHPTINPGCIEGGDSANRIPAHCRLDVDLRFGPDDRIDALRAALREAAAAGLTEPGCRFDASTLFAGIPAFETAAGADIVRACEALTGHKAEAVDFATEGPFLNQLGMDTVILGPGDIAVAHQPNESLPLDRIKPTQELLRALIARFCLGS
jgi:acetylornithine deacetylase